MATGNELTASVGTAIYKTSPSTTVTGNRLSMSVGAAFVSLPGQAGASTDLKEGKMLDMTNWMGG